MDLRLKVIVLCLKNVLNPSLRISVDEGKPCALNLEHQTMTSFERVVYIA